MASANRKVGIPTEKVSITSVEFRNYKAFDHFSVSLQDITVLVGTNNSGKSTVLSVFRALDVALKRARTRKPEYTYGPTGNTFGYNLSPESFPAALENVHTDYADVSSTVTFRLSNDNRLHLFFPEDGGWALIPQPHGKPIRTVAAFKEQYPISIACVPVLGPVEHHEQLVTPETVQRNLNTHLASRHFRNFWHYNPDDFKAFSDLVSATWPGMEVEAPEVLQNEPPELTMYCRENRMTRELFWAGFGFQIWCQLLAHLSRARNSTILVVDEPEVYLHPDVQRQLLALLRSLTLDVLLATHSSEIIAEADPSEILLVEKHRRSAKRLRDVVGVQEVLTAIGSVHNLTLTRLARNRTLLFTEGGGDFDILRDFARKLGLSALASGTDLTPLLSDGFTSMERVKALGWGLEKLGDRLKIAAVYDRDFYCPDHIANLASDLAEHVDLAHIHDRKEIENYLLIVDPLQRAVDKELRDRARREGSSSVPSFDVRLSLDLICESMRLEIQGKYVARWCEFHRRGRRDDSTIATEAIAWFEAQWTSLELRLRIVPGKAVLAAFRSKLQQLHAVSLSTHKIVDAFTSEQIPPDLTRLLHGLQALRADSQASARTGRSRTARVMRKSLL